MGAKSSFKKVENDKKLFNTEYLKQNFFQNKLVKSLNIDK